MPSAGRGFTPEIITRLVANGIQVVPITLHTGVSSQESHEPPYEEYFQVRSRIAPEVDSILETWRSGKHVSTVNGKEG